MKLTIKNYRCFVEELPVVIDIKEGFTSFIGINNSGKSTILKFFYEFRNLFLTLADPGTFSTSLNHTISFNTQPSIYDQTEIFSLVNSNNLVIEIENTAKDLSTNSEVTFKLRLTITRNTNSCKSEVLINEDNIDPSSIRIIGDGSMNVIRPYQVDFRFISDQLLSLSRTLYIGPFRNMINVGSKENYFDIKVGQSFISEWRKMKEGHSKVEKQKAIELSDEINRIFEFKTLEISPSDNDQTLAINIDKESYMLPELGSGLAQFIMVLANASLNSPDYILIDEPELNLHPSLQLDFLTTLAAYAKKGILFTTHNIGLAKMSSDRVYSVHKVSKGKSEVKMLTDLIELPEFLGELSYSGYKELGLDTVLLVEGTSDLRVIQQFLKLLGKEHKVVMIPLGGSNMINGKREVELSEIKRISPNMRVIIDSEKDSETAEIKKDRMSFITICKNLSIEHLVLERRAIENYFTERAIKNIKGDNFCALTPFEKLDERNSLHWKKEEDWLIAKDMTKDELLSTDLGIFLNSL